MTDYKLDDPCQPVPDAQLDRERSIKAELEADGCCEGVVFSDVSESAFVSYEFQFAPQADWRNDLAQQLEELAQDIRNGPPKRETPHERLLKKSIIHECTKRGMPIPQIVIGNDEPTEELSR